MSAPPPPLRLVQFTDPHLYGDPARRMRGVDPLASLRQVLAAAAPAVRQADLILLTGDLVQDDPAGYEHFHGLFGDIGKPVLVIPGNHDDAAALHKAMAVTPFQTRGHIDRGSWRVVLCDSSVPGGVHGELGPAGLAALEAALHGAGQRQVLVVLHHHPVSMHSAWLDPIGLHDAEALFERLDANPRVRGVLFGHVHQIHDSWQAGRRLLGTPSTCVQFKPRHDEFELDTLPPAWRELTLHADGRIETEVRYLGDR